MKVKEIVVTPEEMKNIEEYTKTEKLIHHNTGTDSDPHSKSYPPCFIVGPEPCSKMTYFEKYL